MKNLLLLIALWVTVALTSSQAVLPAQDGAGPTEDAYLSWSAQQAKEIGKSMRSTGRVSAGQGLIHTERAISYKLRATWMTPEVVRATSRLLQLGNRLTDDQARALVAEAEAVGQTVVMVEIDPKEGSGVIPLDWQAFLQPNGLRDGQSGAMAGTNSPKLRGLEALAGVMQRNYNYDVFWVVFSLIDENGKPIFLDSDREAEVIVRIYSKEGKVSWPIPDSIRRRTNQLARRTEL